MKAKFLFLFLALITFGYGQTINFPDANFKAKLLSATPANSVASVQTPNYNTLYYLWSVPSKNTIDTNNDGEIQVSEAQAIQWLDVSSASIANLGGIENFTNLKYLHCGYNSLTTINLAQLTGLKALNCGSNSLGSLNVQGLTDLITLGCFNNQLTALDASNLSQLQNINCINNQISMLSLTGLNSLRALHCYTNQLQNLNVSGLTTLENIDCSYNQLTNLNLIDQINLKYLTCTNNQLTQLNILTLVNLENFKCTSNQLTQLNFQNSVNMKFVRCAGNALTSLDLSHCPVLTYVDCMTNQLQHINVKNGVHSYDLLVNGFYFDNNPNLAYLCCDDSEINTLQIIANANSMGCNIGTYCSFTPNGTFYTVQGNQRFDSNTNGCDAADLIVPNFKFTITNSAITATIAADNNGFYSYPVPAGTYTVTPVIENPAYFNVSPVAFNVSFPPSASPYNQNFCLTPTGTHNNLEIILLPVGIATPGFNSFYKIIYKNKGTTTQSGMVNFAFDDSVLDFVSANPVISAQSTGNLSWNFTNLLPFESRQIDVILNLNTPTETPPLNNGDVLHYTASINGATDETPNDNIAILNQVVVNSYDPNDKTCLEGTTIPPSMVGEYVHYQIRFENNGTANAQNIVVKDLIDTAKFDINTLTPLTASHNFETRISNTNKVEFIFQNINLPFDDANNDGYVLFKIKTNAGLVVGDTFSNSANIYFDYNFPVVTDTYTTTVQILGLEENDPQKMVSFYPNPVNDFIHFESSRNCIKTEVYDISGRIVSTNPVTENKVDLTDLKTGNYILKVYTDKGIFNAKISKE